MKHITTALTVALCFIVIVSPVLAQGKMIQSYLMGWHSEFVDAGFAITGAYVGPSPYNSTMRVLTLVCEIRSEDGWEDTVSLLLSVTDLDTGTTRLSMFDQSARMAQNDLEYFGNNHTARVYCWGSYEQWKQGNTIPMHARVELHSYWGSSTSPWYWCEW